MTKELELSVVIPIYNEAENLLELCLRLIKTLEATQKNFEIIFVEDGTDRSIDIIRNLNMNEPRIKALKLSRNFGHQVSLLAGIDHAKGNTVITMDADLQHPPELIHEMLRYNEQGFDVVYTVRQKNEGESFIKSLLTKLFYWIINKFTKIKLDEGSADFRLMNKKAVEAFKQLRETHRFTRGLVSWIGFKRISIPYIAPSRSKGKTKYNLRKSFRLAFDGILSFSSFPLRIACYLGLIVSFVSSIYAIYLIIIRLRGMSIPAGWTQLMVVIIFFGGLQLFFIGLVGEYISRLFEEAKKRPLYIVDENIGIN